ncbi:hypothetical protein HDU84_006660 [Entophlyctis sp. JEL0112]|nr:hypothetical protein HDU84_006660 [Entophlyctis sp. JEL0112]
MPPRKLKSKLHLQFENYFVNEGLKHVWLGLWIVAQIVYFIVGYYQLATSPVVATFRSVLGPGLMIARSAANVISFDCALILFAVCRNMISYMRQTFLARVIPWDKNITFHILIAYGVVFWSFVHSAAHFYNFYAVELAFGKDTVTAMWLNLLSGPGWTGQVISVALFLMCTSAAEAVRRKHFEIFWFTHHLFIVFFGGTLMHGSFCLIKGDTGDICRGGPTFWKYWIASAVVFVIERITREVRGRFPKTYVSKVVQHPSNVVEVQIMKPSCVTKAGQYIFICCPEISPYEWHPFTLTSSPNEPFISLHIRVVGDFTAKFARRLGCRFGGPEEAGMQPPKSLPYVMVDGPYGSASEDVFDYEVAVLVGGGIGVTPFASILKTVWYRVKQADSMVKLKKVYFIWISRDKEAFEWFQDLLMTIEEENLDGFLDIRSYLTASFKPNEVRNVILNDMDGQKDAITGLKSKTIFGRPNFDQIFQELRAQHPGTDAGVFFCGPKPISATLHKACNKWTDASANGMRFYYGKENF